MQCGMRVHGGTCLCMCPQLPTRQGKHTHVGPSANMQHVAVQLHLAPWGGKPAHAQQGALGAGGAPWVQLARPWAHLCPWPLWPCGPTRHQHPTSGLAGHCSVLHPMGPAVPPLAQTHPGAMQQPVAPWQQVPTSLANCRVLRLTAQAVPAWPHLAASVATCLALGPHGCTSPHVFCLFPDEDCDALYYWKHTDCRRPSQQARSAIGDASKAVLWAQQFKKLTS